MELKELYQEIILDHGKNPRNKGICNQFNHDAKGHNPLCGDKIHIYLKLNKEINVTEKIIEDFLNMIKQETRLSINSLSEDQKTTIMSLSGVKQFPMRVKCATMAWHTLTSALEGKNG